MRHRMPLESFYDEEVQRHWSSGCLHETVGGGFPLVSVTPRPAVGLVPAGRPCPRCIGGQMFPEDGGGWHCIHCGHEGA